MLVLLSEEERRAVGEQTLAPVVFSCFLLSGLTGLPLRLCALPICAPCLCARGHTSYHACVGWDTPRNKRPRVEISKNLQTQGERGERRKRVGVFACSSVLQLTNNKH